MAFDGFFTHAMVVELNQLLASGRTQRSIADVDELSIAV